jgi:hypothetical protein
MSSRPKPGREPIIPTQRLLGAILERTRTTTRGVKIADLLPIFAARATAFARFRALERDGLITRVEGASGEYVLSAAGMVAYNEAQKEP